MRDDYIEVSERSLKISLFVVAAIKAEAYTDALNAVAAIPAPYKIRGDFETFSSYHEGKSDFKDTALAAIDALLKEQETCKRLEDVVETYKATTSTTRVILTMAVYDRYRALDIAARLEAECATCYGPDHKAALDEVRRAR